MRALLGIALVVASLPFLFLSAGCATTAQKADKLNASTHEKTAQIRDAAQAAQGHIAAADHEVQAAATQPANPPETTAHLAKAHENLSAGQKDLAPIAPAAAAIENNSTQAAKLTASVQKKLTKERASFWSYRQRLLFWGSILLAIPAAVLVFIFKTNGAGPIFAAIGEIGGDVISIVWSYILKPAATALFHVYTLGAGALANVVNRHYDAQQAAQQRAVTLPPNAASAPQTPPTKT